MSGTDVATVTYRLSDTVGVVTLDAPARRNALSPEMRKAAIEAFQHLATDSSCRVIVIHGAGAHFSSGGDLKSVQEEASAPDPIRTRERVGLLHDLIRLIVAGPKPVIAAVEGTAFGAGLSVAAACDYVVASKEAVFCASFGRVGLMADAGLMWSLPQRVGAIKARQIVLTGRLVKADEAERLGLADELAEPGTVLEAAMRRSAMFMSTAPLAIASMKAVFGGSDATLEGIFASEAEIQPRLTLSDDYREGRQSFFQRKAPVFTGR